MSHVRTLRRMHPAAEHPIRAENIVVGNPGELKPTHTGVRCGVTGLCGWLSSPTNHFDQPFG